MTSTPTPQHPPVTALANNPLAALSPMLNAHGELDWSNLQMGERLQGFMDFVSKANCNLPLWENNIFAQFPAGTTMLPIPVIPGHLDAWRGADAKKMGLKEGMVEPSADFHIKLANVLGIQLRQVFAGVTNDTGVDMYSVRYNAYLTLPNGAVLSVEDEGKDQCLYNSGGLQAHIIENTRKKAKRNAIKALLGIPTSMPEKDFDRPWVVLRPVYHEGVSAETDRIIAEQRTISEENTRRLYGRPTVDVTAQRGPDISELQQAIEAAQTLPELEVAQKRIAASRLTGDERAQLGSLFKTRKQLLDTGEVVAPPPQDPPAQPQQPAAQAPANNGGF